MTNNRLLLKIVAFLMALIFGLGWSLSRVLAEDGLGQKVEKSSAPKISSEVAPVVNPTPAQGGQGQESEDKSAPAPATVPSQAQSDGSEMEGQGEGSIHATSSHATSSEMENENENASSSEMENENEGGGHASSSRATLAAQDFGVVNYDTGLGILTGYTAGFGLTNATFAGVQSVVVKLYSSSTLLQTNTATPKVGATLTGAQISSPFDVLGSFDYATDGYWTNVREAEYGLHLVPTKVIAVVTLANGKIVTAENDTLTGDPSIIVPAVPPAGPVLSFIMPVNIASSSASILWLSSDQADARVWISTSTPVDTSGAPAASSSVQSIFHFLDLSGLMPATTYHFIVASTDATSTTFSPDEMFTTGN